MLVKEKTNPEMILREYQSTDCKELAQLFYNTIHIVNAKDYTKEQLDAWATGQIDLKKWNQSLQEHFSIVVIVTAICSRLEAAVQGNLVTHASITARPFFEKRGYKVVKEQQIERQGIFLTNFVMRKER